MKKLSLIVATLITLIIFSTEIYLKNLGLGDPIRYDSSIFFGYSPKSNQQKKRINNSKVTINDVGLRTIYDWNQIQGKKIIFLGDSVTYGGSYIDDTEIFSHLVCEKLVEYVCGNAGVNSYGVYNTVMRSRFDKRLQDADIYIYLFPPDDFIRDYRNSKTAHFYLNNKNFFLPAITEAINFVSIKYDINNLISKKDDSKSDLNDVFSFINYSINILNNEIENKKNENKKTFVFLSNRKNDKNFNKKINRYIKENLNHNIKIYLLNEALNKDEYFYDEGVHLSKKGHLIVADEIVKVLNSEKIYN